MSDRRMIHKSFFESESVSEWSIRQRLLVIGIIALADDQGRIRAHPRWLKSQIFPYDDIASSDISEDLEAIAATNDTLMLYDIDGKQYAQLINWWEYQSLQWARPSEFPAPPEWADQIRQLVYQPKRWVMTLNWPGSEDCTEYKPMALGNGLGDALALINTTTTINLPEEEVLNTEFRNLFDVFLRASGVSELLISPQKSADAIRGWVKAGVNPEQIETAVHELQERKYSIVGPWSINNAIAAVMSRNDHEGKKLEGYSYGGS